MPQNIMMIIYGVPFLIIAIFTCFLCHRLAKMKSQCVDTEKALEKSLEDGRLLNIEVNALKSQIVDFRLHDPLTGLISRTVFEDRLKQTIYESEHYQLLFAVVTLDLDGFKVINSVLGYEVGDAVLKEVASRLRTCIRQVDTACRMTGDQFNFILPKLTKPETAAFVAKRFLDEIALPFYTQEQELFLTACIGIAIYPTDGSETKVLLKNSDSALQQAKVRGRNTYQFYQEEMHALSRRELLLSSSLHQNNIFEEFVVYYQPAIDFQHKSVFSMEALLRWQHPDFGLIAPREFLRLAENSGKSIEIDEWVLGQACKQFVVWQKAGFHPAFFSVNISLHQLENPHFPYRISQILREHALSPPQLMLEISEGTLQSKFELIEKTLFVIKTLGVKIVIDNFGTGRLSLQHLKRFPIDYLKIDTTLTHDIITNKESLIIVKMIVALANSLQINVLAEGVESQHQKDILQELGCQVLQGHLFCYPQLPSEFPRMINEKLSLL